MVAVFATEPDVALRDSDATIVHVLSNGIGTVLRGEQPVAGIEGTLHVVPPHEVNVVIYPFPASAAVVVVRSSVETTTRNKEAIS